MLKHSMLLALSWGTFSMAPIAAPDLTPQKLPVYGGSGGVAFERSCGAGKVLTGFRYRTGMFLDAVGLLCRPVYADGTLGPETSVGTLAGGGGGTSSAHGCAAGGVVTGVTIHAGTFINGIHVTCMHWLAAERRYALEDFGWFFGTTVPYPKKEACESDRQPAHGIRGRAATYVDAFGVVCDEP